MPDKIRLLVIDDDEDDHLFVREAIRSLRVVNGEVISCYDGVQGMDYLLKRNNFKDLHEPSPDFIILDLNMPKLDGWELLSEIKKHSDLKNIPVYILTTSRAEDHREKCIKLGCVEFFSKPSKLEHLKAMVQQMLEGLISMETAL